MSGHMPIEDIITYMIDTYGDSVREDRNWGERGVFYNPDRALPKGVYLLTFKESDGPNDKASCTDRAGVYRLNLGISKPAFQELFGGIPKRPAAGCIVETGHDFTQLDQIMPHPVYGWMSWLGILNPSPETFDRIKPLIDDAVKLAAGKFARRIAGKK